MKEPIWFLGVVWLPAGEEQGGNRYLVEIQRELKGSPIVLQVVDESTKVLFYISSCMAHNLVSLDFGYLWAWMDGVSKRYRPTSEKRTIDSICCAFT